MSVRTKKHPIDNLVIITIHGAPEKTFLIPRAAQPQLMTFLKSLQTDESEEYVPASEVFKDLYEKYGKIGVTLRGCRARDGMTQVQLAAKLGIPKAHIAEMEHSKRPIDKKMAQKLAKIFNTDYKLFL